MQHHYSTVNAEEQQQAVGQVVKLFEKEKVMAIEDEVDWARGCALGAEWVGGLSKQELGGTGLIAVSYFLVVLMNYGRDGNGYTGDQVKEALEYILFDQVPLVTRNESDRLKSERLQEFLTKMLSERRR